MDKYLEKILKKMCKMVGADYDAIDFKSSNWFLTHSWTKKKQDSFRQWFIDYLSDNGEARKILMRFPKKDKKWVELAVDNFIFQYGWKEEDK